MTISREGFMLIMADLWKGWATKDMIVAAEKQVGIAMNGLNVEWMQQDKFDQAVACIQMAASPSPSGVNTWLPLVNVMEQPHTGKENVRCAWCLLPVEWLVTGLVTGLLVVNNIKAKPGKENVQITQVQGSMDWILEMVYEINKY